MAEVCYIQGSQTGHKEQGKSDVKCRGLMRWKADTQRKYDLQYLSRFVEIAWVYIGKKAIQGNGNHEFYHATRGSKSLHSDRRQEAYVFCEDPQ